MGRATGPKAKRCRGRRYGVRMSDVRTEDVHHRSDVDEIERLVEAFLGAFVSAPDSGRRLQALRDLFVPRAVIVRTCGQEPVVYDVDGFLAPRAELLSSGELVDFREWPLTGSTQIFGDVAHYFGSYAKSWVHNGVAFSGRGMKSLQLVRTAQGWRISAVAWDDERDGLRIDA